MRLASESAGANLVATTFGRGVVGDFNNDGLPDLTIVSPRDAASGLPSSAYSLTLPYIEQDNLYKSTHIQALDAGVAPDATRSQIIAVLIGFQNSRQTAEAHDAVFAEVGASAGDALVVEKTPPQLMALLLPLMHKPGEGNVLDITDGTSNTVMFGEAR